MKTILVIKSIRSGLDGESNGERKRKVVRCTSRALPEWNATIIRGAGACARRDPHRVSYV